VYAGVGWVACSGALVVQHQAAAEGAEVLVVLLPQLHAAHVEVCKQAPPAQPVNVLGFYTMWQYPSTVGRYWWAMYVAQQCIYASAEHCKTKISKDMASSRTALMLLIDAFTVQHRTRYVGNSHRPDQHMQAIVQCMHSTWKTAYLDSCQAHADRFQTHPCSEEASWHLHLAMPSFSQ
jgi:hypothetical protein